MKKHLLPRSCCALALLAGMITFTACKTVNTVEPKHPVSHREYIMDKRVVTDKALAEKTAVVAVNTATTSDGFLRVQIEIVNTTKRVCDFTYRFEWLDPNGILLSTPASTAIERQIEGGESLLLVGVAPTPTAKDFRIKFTPHFRQ